MKRITLRQARQWLSLIKGNRTPNEQGKALDHIYETAIIEDDPAHLAGIAAAIGQSPSASQLNLLGFASAHALQAFLSCRNHLDVALIDIELGDGEQNGIELAHELLAANPRVQVIYVTGHVEYCTQAYETSHVYYLLKPLQQHYLDDALARAIENLEIATPPPQDSR